jgi:hypothetical protein
VLPRQAFEIPVDEADGFFESVAVALGGSVKELGDLAGFFHGEDYMGTFPKPRRKPPFGKRPQLC